MIRKKKKNKKKACSAAGLGKTRETSGREKNPGGATPWGVGAGGQSGAKKGKNPGKCVCGPREKRDFRFKARLPTKVRPSNWHQEWAHTLNKKR